MNKIKLTLRSSLQLCIDKYDQVVDAIRLRITYRKANHEIREAIMLSRTTGKTYYVLPLNDGFKALNNKEILALRRMRVLNPKVDCVALYKSAVYISQNAGTKNTMNKESMLAYLKNKGL